MRGLGVRWERTTDRRAPASEKTSWGRDALDELRCDLAQGYVLGRPMSALQLSEWLTPAHGSKLLDDSVVSEAAARIEAAVGAAVAGASLRAGWP